MNEIKPIEMLKPISPIESLFGQSSAQKTGNSQGVFKELFTAAMDNVSDTDKASADDTESLAVGEVDDLHTLGINNMKSYLAVDMLIQIRNKALDAYSQVMQINV